MYETFESCARALLQDEQRDAAKGGVIFKNNNRFDYTLNNQPEPDEGEPFLGVYPSATPDVTWRVMFHGGQEAEAAYREFTANPENGYFQ